MIGIFKIIGIIGMLLIVVGIIIKNRKIEDIFYIAGGVLLEIYSIHLQDMIFIILQLIFILAAVYDLLKIEEKNWFRLNLGRRSNSTSMPDEQNIVKK